MTMNELVQFNPIAMRAAASQACGLLAPAKN